MERVVVALSGGVDSSVAAYLLQQEGYEVIGLFMKNWHDDSVTLSGECPWLEDSNDALRVADKLNIPFQTIDLSQEYKERIVDYMFGEYHKGRTPNPDVLCNREIKFDAFLEHALQLEADHVATGHYCRKETLPTEDGPVHRLLAGQDRNKDQSYFLCQVTQEQLSRALFPVGELTKPEVRKIAAEQGLATADKKDSQGLCFVGKVRLPEFLQQQLAPKPGRVIEVPADASLFQKNGHTPTLQELASPYSFSDSGEGRDIGEHQGAHFFTVGQRKGIGIGGTAEPLFVLERDVNNNTLYTGQGEDHPGLYRRGLFISPDELHWVRPDRKLHPGEELRCQARIRYRQPLEPATLYQKEEGTYLIFDAPQRGITSGQFASWYKGDELLGSGVIHA